MGMETSLAELPLALFSTLTRMGAGAFGLLAIAFFTRSYDEAALKKIDKMTIVPLAFVLIGFVCASFHLANPIHAINVLTNVGSSPLSNEILVGIIFCVIAVVYWLVMLLGKASYGVRKGLAALTAVCGLVLCVFIGAAYGVNTIPSWDTIMSPLSILCYGLLGGSAVGLIVLHPIASEEKGSSASAYLVVSWAGAIGSALFLCIQMGMASGLSNNMFYGSDIVGTLIPWIVVAVIFILATGVALMMEIRKQKPMYYQWVVVALAFVGILIARLCFYGIEFSVGLGL